MRLHNGTFTASFTNDAGRTFNVRVLFNGDAYGLNDCLTWDKEKPGVEFWDASFGNNELGHFTGARYFADTICFKDAWTPEKGFHNTGELQQGGLCLDCGNREVWSIDAKTMRDIRLWILGVTTAQQLMRKVAL